MVALEGLRRWRRTMKRVVLVVALAALSLIAFASPVAAHGLPLPGWGLVADAACNPATEGKFLTTSFAVPMDGTFGGEPWCMTMNSSWRTQVVIVGPPGNPW
jgi:hypothetical protein